MTPIPHISIGSGGRDCARPPSHTTGHAVFSHPAVGAGGRRGLACQARNSETSGSTPDPTGGSSFSAFIRGLSPGSSVPPRPPRPPESTGGLRGRGRGSQPLGRRLRMTRRRLAASEVSSRLRPFAPAAFTAFLATKASADFCPPLSGQISPGRVHGLSGRAAGLYLVRLSVTVGFRGVGATHA